MSAYTLAGPDIGVTRVSFAELCQELGDEAALVAANALETGGGIHRVPGLEPIRLVRTHKDGDEAQGYNYFARRAGLSREEQQEARVEPDDAPKIIETNRNAPIEGERFGMSAQHLNHLHHEQGVTLKQVTAVISTAVPLSFYVRAATDDEAAEVVRRYISGEDFAPNTGILLDPKIVVAHTLSALRRQETLEDAGWEARVVRVEGITAETTEKLLKQLLAEELRDFQHEVASNVDMLASFLERV